MSAKNINPVMGAKGRYLEALAHAEANEADPKRIARSEHNRAKYAASKLSATTPIELARNSIPNSSTAQEDTKPRYCICHGDRPIAYHSLCQQSVDSLRFTRPPKLPSDVVGVFRQRAMEVAWRVKPAKTKYELTQDKMAKPEVAEYVAANVIKKGMDYEAGVAAALPEIKDSVEIGITANIAKQSPAVQLALNESLKKRGLDGDSREAFVTQLWSWFLSTNPAEERRQLQAARILGEHFIKNAPPSNELAVLHIEGIDDGLKKMFGADYDTVKNLKPVSTDVPVEEFEEDDSEIGED